MVKMYRCSHPVWKFYMSICYIATCCTTESIFEQQKPNIVFILTDDQDVELGGMTPMSKAKKLIGDAGITFKNMFVTSPLCCPSRSSILTGNYVHNHGALNNSLSGNCSSAAWQATAEKHTFANYLNQQQYTTFFAGKYLNKYGLSRAGGVKHIPPGWDHWIGLVGNSVYYNYTLSVDGKAEHHGDDYKADYLTNVIADRADMFLKSRTTSTKPFFLMLSTPACHAPFTPAPQYQKSFANVSAPKTGSFNHYSKDKHWLLRQAKHPLGEESLQYIEKTYKNRWRTLLSVDDLVERVITRLQKQQLLDNTYVIFSSDNGFHLGQMSLPNDKRQLYEFDIRVPLMVRGPGVRAGQIRQEVILNIDLAPTFISLSGGTPPSTMDGESFHTLLLNSTAPVVSTWRQDFMVEHSGEHHENVPGCPQYKEQGMANCFPECVCEDAHNNSYNCVRTLSASENLMYCMFADNENFVEVYNLTSDPHQLTNIRKTIDPKILLRQNSRLLKLTVCAGPPCRRPTQPWPPLDWNCDVQKPPYAVHNEN